MVVWELNLVRITKNLNAKVRIYRPVIGDIYREYGVAEKWLSIGDFPIWSCDSSITNYGGEDGINARKTSQGYVQSTSPLPDRVGVHFITPDDIESDSPIYPSLSVDTFYDFNLKYAYSVVVV